MNVKQYREPTVREALRAVREELGPDALVISTELVASAGWRGWLGAREVRVTAGATPVTSESRTAAVDRRHTDTVAGPAQGRESIVARLVAGGVARAMAEQVAAAMPSAECRGASLATLTRALATNLGDMAAGDEPFARVEVFVGPPGVGKTTTIAKIAAQTRAREGRALGMVAGDAFRAGAIEQLRAYAEIIGAPFKVARTTRELDKALSSSRHPLLVDTAGRSPSDGGVRDLLRLVGRRRGVRTHLVMAADTSAATARRIFDTYQDARPDRLVVTKIDEAESLSPLLGVVRERGLPISYLTAGQRVPEDLDRATAALIAGAVLRDPLDLERMNTPRCA
jgi:flagellar biosynthesis protein FlhF